MATITKWYAVRVDEAVREKIMSNGKFGEDMNTVLRRLLKMPPRVRPDNGGVKITKK